MELVKCIETEPRPLLAILKNKSPSCGHGRIYDGTFTGTLVPGDGMAAELLKKNGVTVYGESNIDELL